MSQVRFRQDMWIPVRLTCLEIAIRHTPSYSLARVTLGGGEQVCAESGSMASMSLGMQIEAAAKGGVLKSLTRGVLGGESVFVSTYTAPAPGGFIELTPTLSGDITEVEITDDMALFITRGCWLASSPTIELDTKWGGFKNFFGGEGGFIIKAVGAGQVLLSCHGALDCFDLSETGPMTIDTGHVVAYDESVEIGIRKAAPGLVQSIKSGEGLVFDVQGSGRVWMQSRNPSGLASWIAGMHSHG